MEKNPSPGSLCDPTSPYGRGKHASAARSRTTSCRKLLLLGPRGLRSRLRLAQFMARQLAYRRARQFLDELDRCRQLVLAELAGQESAQLVHGERRSSRAQRDEGLGRL